MYVLNTSEWQTLKKKLGDQVYHLLLLFQMRPANLSTVTGVALYRENVGGPWLTQRIIYIYIYIYIYIHTHTHTHNSQILPICTFCTKVDGRKFGKIPLERLGFRVVVSVARYESDNRQSLQKSSRLSLSIVRLSARETMEASGNESGSAWGLEDVWPRAAYKQSIRKVSAANSSLPSAEFGTASFLSHLLKVRMYENKVILRRTTRGC